MCLTTSRIEAPFGAGSHCEATARRRACGMVSVMELNAFVLSQVAPPPRRVLEVGCGHGELALPLAEAGYELVAIDPEAPEGEIFCRTRIEAFDDPGPFDA